ncbi:MAG TPA: PD-(D/E)XK nuclease family protein, partial [Alphaproteobacteria bacterium]|nr:PD-(D/E)XK nuclease family protein [Alphaproteobacteria bacterium]
LDNPDQIINTKRPEPTPPLAARPQKLSVTSIETWLTDPYQIYARHVLDLKSLDPLEKPLDPAGRGSLIHDILERFIKAHPLTLPPDAHDTLLALARECITLESLDESALHFWWPRFEAMMEWFLAEEHSWRARGASPYLQEAKGHWAFTTQSGANFALTARADRIDRMKGGSDFAIIDYKTGGDYSPGQIESGKRPQLPLEALMLGEGAFEGAATAASAAFLAFWVLKGAKPPGFKAELSEQVDSLAKQARTLLEGLVDRYADPATPYPAVPDPARPPAFNDYAHLARLKEWSAESGAEGEED